MVFSSIIFLFVFLPAVLFVYFITKPAYRNIILLTASLLFYAWGEPIYVVLLLGSIAINYLFGKWLETGDERAPKYRIVVALSANLLLLGVFKYAGFFINMFFKAFHINSTVPNIPFPLGISFFTFHAMSYLVDAYRKMVPVQKNPYVFALYTSLFPKLVAGPIVRYKEIFTQFYARPVNISDVSAGIERFICGLSKKLLVANQAGAIADSVFGMQASSLTCLSSWIGIIAYTLQIYFDFSGYTDMAVGLGRTFGFRFPENFNYPYASRSITEFWRRWHMTLSAWFRDYLYIPLGGNRGTQLQTARNILIVWTLTGFWHGASLTFMAWGFYYGVLLLLEKTVFKKVTLRLPPVVGHLYALLIVMIGWVFFRADDFGYSFQYLGVLFGYGAKSMTDAQAILLMRDNWFIFVIGAVCSFPFIPWLRAQLEIRTPIFIMSYSRTVIYSFALLLNVMLLVNATYNPFIYFRF